MTELQLKLSLPDQLANQAKAAGLLTSESIERLVREAFRKAAEEEIDDPLFGMWRNREDMADVQAYVRKLRAPRF